MRKAILIVLVSISVLMAWGKDEKKEKQLQNLKAQLQLARDSLQNEIARRWRLKQKYIGRREIDKEELARLRDMQERAYLDLTRVKEECFTRERKIADEKVSLQKKKDAWRYVAESVDELFEKDAQKVLDVFPLDREKRRL